MNDKTIPVTQPSLPETCRIHALPGKNMEK